MRPSLRSTAIAPLAAAVLFSACSSSSTSPSGASSAATDAGADAGNLVTASFHMEETVAAGQEIFDCQFVALPDVQAFMIKGQHQYTPGSHHLLMYTTDLTSIPAGQSGVQSCYEGTGGANNVMGHVRGVLYAGQVPMGSEPLPPGIGLETSPSQVLLFQVHYLNATASSLDVKVDVQLTLDTGNDIVQKAGIFFFYDPFIDVPAGAMAKASMRCPVPDDITLLYASSHYHARGDGYGAYIDPAVDQLATKPFYTSSSWSSPPNQQMSMPIKGGSRLRFECDYDNSAGTAGYFQGPSAQTNEMCMFIGIYYPEMSEVADYCASGQDMYGSGTATCSATLSCLQACGKITFGSLNTAAPSCEQTCMVDSCPTATGSLMPLLSCVKSNCATPCGSAASAACTSCIASSCASQASACQAQTCP
jgi:hypothetical protein